MAKLIAFSDEIFYSVTIWHLVAFAVVFLFVVVFLILAAFVSHKPKTSLILQLLSLATLTVGPIFAYLAVEKIYKPVTISDLTIKHLYFQDIGELRGVITNNSKLDLIDCKIKAKAYKAPKNSIDYIGKIIKPQSKGVTKLSIKAESAVRFEIDLIGIKYSDQNISASISVRCR